ncbi:unnamed protein product [Arctia plantaginis]|uniref:Lysophospholipid acyltransferase 7 n=1 Tax=Arctia plantaginis TaxID=874455 RepID=A0A8S0YT58_ARCPL|nr:unnamed protein product [Arctia plantaginis]
MKRNYGTGLGILIVYLICGTHIYHSVLITWGNIIIIKCCDKRYLHHISLSYTWTYLAYMHIIEKYQSLPYILWVHQAIALRLVGMAFEISLNERIKNEAQEQKNQSSKPTVDNVENSIPEDPKAIEIIAYAYFFIGLHKGPYYRWKIFQDHFETPFGVLGDCRVITEQKLKKLAAYVILFMVLRTNFPIEIYYQDNFYVEYGADSRYLYNLPHLVMYCLQHQIVMTLCSSICTEAGFGVYPAKCNPLPGHGPSARLSLLKLAASNNDVALEQEYNFAVLRSFEFDKMVFGPKMQDTLRAWDISTRYWFYAHAYKNTCKAQKQIRKLLTYLLWSLWCGPSLQQFIIASTLYVHTQLEKEYAALQVPNESMKVTWEVGYSITRLLCLTYLTPCLIIQNPMVVLKYYNSILWMYHFLLLVFIIAALESYHDMSVAKA